jgi:hypothetical protein
MTMMIGNLNMVDKGPGGHCLVGIDHIVGKCVGLD